MRERESEEFHLGKKVEVCLVDRKVSFEVMWDIARYVIFFIMDRIGLQNNCSHSFFFFYLHIQKSLSFKF